MALKVSGKLKSAASVQPSFADYRIEALFNRKQATAQCKPPTSRPTLAEHLEYATLTSTESDSDFAPELGAIPTVTPTSAGAPIPFRVSALSDAAGNFTLEFPDPQEIASEKVKVVVFSPADRIVGELELVAYDLGDPITIEVRGFGPTTPYKPAAQLNTPQSVAVDALFRADAALRHAVTENLKSLRGESDAIATRIEKAWKFNPSQLSAEELTRRRHVPPGADPSDMLETVIISGVDALRSANTDRAITLRNDAELMNLIKEAPEPADSLHGVVELGPLIDIINRKSAGFSLVTEPTYALYKAELEADKLLDDIENTAKSRNGAGVSSLEDSSSEISEADQFVKDSVNLQMKSATSPESQLAYGKIPNSADEDKVQSGILQTFQLRPGASDVTSYHDFHTLQIAFEHVWTEIFDGQLESLGRELYREYVKLKDFIGSTQPDLQVGTFADLRRLMDEIKKLSQTVQDDIPSSLRPEGGDQKNNGLGSVTPEDGARFGGAVATGGVSLFIEWAFNELIKLGNKPVIATWKDFPLKLNEGRGNIIELLPPEKNAVYPGNVEIVLETDSNSFKKQIVFQQWDSEMQRPIYNAEVQNFGTGHGAERGPSGAIIDRLLLNTPQIASGTLKFISEDEIVPQLLLGRYVLGDLTEALKDRTRVTFRWKGQR